jgi:hypothetical protein
MKVRFILAIAAFATGFVQPIFAQKNDRVDPNVEQQIHVLTAQHDEAFNKNDARALGALFSGTKI